MVNSVKGRLHKFRQGKHTRYFVYIPMVMTEDSMWPCFLEKGQSVTVTIRIEEKTLKIEETEE